MAKERKKDKWNIAMFGSKRVPGREGGCEVVVEELSTRMAAMGNRVVVYNRRGHHVSGEQYDTGRLREYQGVKLKEVFTINGHAGFAAVSSSASAAIHTAFGNYDVVHIHAEGPALMCWLPKLFGKKIIVTIHGLDHRRAKWGRFARAYIMAGEKAAVKYADEIIVLSKSVQSYFKNSYNRKTHFIPNGVNRPEIRNEETIQRNFGLKKDGYFLYLGRIVPEKGLVCLIEAFRRVKTEKKLVIAGGISDTNTFYQELRKQSSGDKRILFTGFVQGELLESLYSNAYVYVLPSDLEGMPLSLLEAMSYGNCCLVSDIPECADVVGKYGIVFGKGSMEELKKALQKLNDNPSMVQKFRETAADYICKKFNWNDVVQKTLKLYG